MESQKVLFKGEVQLAGWNESHTGGMKHTWWVSEDARDEFERIKLMTTRKGNMSGQRAMMVIVEINDEGQPVSQERAQEEAPSIKGGALSKLAALWCKTPAFQQWIAAEFNDIVLDVGTRIAEPSDEELATHAIYAVCGIKSRAELDSNPEAKESFNELIRHPFSQTL